MKVHQYLEQLFRFRLLSNDQIRPYIKKLATMGRLDGPKVNDILTELLVRVAQLEDKEEQERKMSLTTPAKQTTPGSISLDDSWSELRKKGKELGIYKVGQTKQELIELIQHSK